MRIKSVLCKMKRDLCKVVAFITTAAVVAGYGE